MTPTVRMMMSSPVLSIPPTMRLPLIKSMMRSHNIRRLPVVDGARLVGIITLGDLRNAFPSDATTLSIYELSYMLDKVQAREIMRTGVITIDPDAPLTAAAQLMLTHKVSGLVVLEHDQPIGILTESDFFGH